MGISDDLLDKFGDVGVDNGDIDCISDWNGSGSNDA